MANVAAEEIIKLIDKELATETNESLTVLRKEIDEAGERMTEIEQYTTELWQGIKENPETVRKRYSAMYASATQLAIEAVQIAAMARKGIISSFEITFTANKGGGDA